MVNQKEKLQAWVTELISLPVPNANHMFSIHQHASSPFAFSCSSQAKKQGTVPLTGQLINCLLIKMGFVI